MVVSRKTRLTILYNLRYNCKNQALKYIFEKVMTILVPKCRGVRCPVTWALRKSYYESSMELTSKQYRISKK